MINIIEDVVDINNENTDYKGHSYGTIHNKLIQIIQKHTVIGSFYSYMIIYLFIVYFEYPGHNPLLGAGRGIFRT